MGPINPVVNKNLGMPGNDDRHDRPDFNRGGGPTTRTRKKVAPKDRGGFGQHGQRRFVKAGMGGGRGSSGNPADRGSVRPVGRQSFPSETRNPNGGGGPQVRDSMGTVANRGGFGHSGQQGVPGVRTNPQPGAGNVSGRMAQRVTGRFNQASKGSKAGSVGRSAGKWGGPPVRLDN
jgi:hypothetical protein